MKKVSPWLKKCPKWGPQKGVRGCQYTAFEFPFSIIDRGRSSQTSQDPSQTSQAVILVLFRRSFQSFFSCASGTKWHGEQSRPRNATKKMARVPSLYCAVSPECFAAEYITGLKMPRKKWREFSPCIVQFLLNVSPQSTQQD